jgi:hypothetical protein
MTFLLENLFSLLYLFAIVAGIGWWLWVIRRSRQAARPRRTETENVEVARLRAQLAQMDGEAGTDQRPR